MIENLWNSFEIEGYWGFKCKEKVKKLRQHLKTWNKEVFGNIDSQLEEALKKIEIVDVRCEDQDPSDDDILKRKDGFAELWVCLKKKESLWRKKSRATWIKERDANTGFFHRIINGRRKKNMLWRLTTMAPGLMSPYDEIRDAVFSCASDKAPGPDGLNFHFIKTIWNTIERDVINFIKEFHRNGKLVKGLNSSYITLVPKKKNPTSLKEFRPISMVGCLYKILAKVLANRLQKVIGKVISASQSAFLKGRQLVDNVLTRNELVHDMKSRRKKGIIFKADFEKAFDSVDWGYLDTIHHLLGFGEKWRSWIKECLSSASVSVLVNGSPTQEFKMQRGLRQGDPLSPYLFLIAAEGLHALLLEAEMKDMFKGVKVDENTLVSHLQFADDTALLCEASTNSVWTIKCALRWFEIMSGLRINFNKSILYGINVDEQWLSMAALALNCKVGKLPFIYLGLPVGVADLKPTNSESWNLQWRRSPFGRELDELKILEDTLRSATIFEGKADRKIWKHYPS
ncbi:hypothetical protein SLEP1_g3529 [Rubroshorea leprosula]|uniref:Reverse transcriptase domain-containing protein n=1 Tax=Rubroshorea leprosula TaxID=152421 RepID=A0AAV5HUI1_9ROSI|nr:hypothetical protein SLEP1_g3529 [Rubroshorea leprosula]